MQDIPNTDWRATCPTVAAEALTTFYRAFAGEPDLLDDVVTPTWRDMPLGPGQDPGPTGIKPMIRALKEALPDLAITITDVVAADVRLAVRATMSGTHSGTWLGVAPTGRRVAVALHEFHRIEDGRLAMTWHLEDWFGFLGQVGAWPPSKETAR